ncbi:hypothetical protein BD560DRAFT_403348 [Blakeslea trispora]|nr:hypothetical protein BD560DRAFT_403348 [Blakeslea trispora]
MSIKKNSQCLGRSHQIDKDKRRLSLSEPSSSSFSFPIKSSSSTPLHNPKKSQDLSEQWQFLREMEQAREEIAEIRKNMAGLVEHMDTMTLELTTSEERVYQIEQDVTTTEEFNVNLQVILDKAKKSQKETDVFTHQAIKNIYSDLALVVYENNQLQGRLASIEQHQRQQKGSIHDMMKHVEEYRQMLEQAQSTIHMLQEPRLMPSIASSSRRSSVSLVEEDDNQSISSTFSIKRPPYAPSPPLGPLLSKSQQNRLLFEHTIPPST